jgi:16S rRNA (cytidine1402-2'-O)-methyltransferase
MEELRATRCALVFYEAPHRVLETVADLVDLLGERTHRHCPRADQAVRIHRMPCPLTEAPAWLEADANRQRGEFVLMVSGAAADGGRSGRSRARAGKLLLAEAAGEAGGQAGRRDHRRSRRTHCMSGRWR